MISSFTARPRDPFLSLIDRFLGEAAPEVMSADHLPRTNIVETPTSYTIDLELPGVEEKDIEVELLDHQLTVRAERKSEAKSEGKTWHRVEHRYGKLSRTIALPKDARSEGIEATYRKGILTVSVQKVPEAKPTRVQIRGD